MKDGSELIPKCASSDLGCFGNIVLVLRVRLSPGVSTTTSICATLGSQKQRFETSLPLPVFSQAGSHP